VQDPRGFIAKLSDFGLSMKMAAHDGQVPGIKYGTVQYLAPEVLNTHIMTKKADVYSFGIIMWEVWHSRLFAEFYNNEKRKRKAYAAIPQCSTCSLPNACAVPRSVCAPVTWVRMQERAEYGGLQAHGELQVPQILRAAHDAVLRSQPRKAPGLPGRPGQHCD
jgi:serine/threonine protein kinase